MKTILITGAAGFIGGHACALFQRQGWRVIGMDRGEPVWRVGDSFHRCDLLDREGLLALARQINPAVILHLGAATRVAGLRWEDYAVNVAGVDNVIAAVEAAPACERVIFASTRLICPVYHRALTSGTIVRPTSTGRVRWRAKSSCARVACGCHGS